MHRRDGPRRHRGDQERHRDDRHRRPRRRHHHRRDGAGTCPESGEDRPGRRHRDEAASSRGPAANHRDEAASDQATAETRPAHPDAVRPDGAAHRAEEHPAEHLEALRTPRVPRRPADRPGRAAGPETGSCKGCYQARTAEGRAGDPASAEWIPVPERRHQRRVRQRQVGRRPRARQASPDAAWSQPDHPAPEGADPDEPRGNQPDGHQPELAGTGQPAGPRPRRPGELPPGPAPGPIG